MSEHEPKNVGAPLKINVHDELIMTERLGWKKMIAGQKTTVAWGHDRDDVGDPRRCRQ